jgi:hypothetical protein
VCSPSVQTGVAWCAWARLRRGGGNYAVGVIDLRGLELEHPVVVASFQGWNDGAEAASNALAHLAEVAGASQVGAMDPEPYYDFQVNRPNVRLDEDGRRRIIWPTTRLLAGTIPDSHHDLLLVDGIEPSVRWRSFAAELVDLVRGVGAEVVVLLGALLADQSHRLPTNVTGVTGDDALVRRLGLTPSRYEGPTGIVGVLQEALSTAGMPTVSFWAAVPYYVAAPPCPKATLALLHRVEDVLDVSLPVGELADDARAWERGVEELLSQDDELAAIVAELDNDSEGALRETSGEALAKEFERYLRRRRPDG